jgi:hypothetical protein
MALMTKGQIRTAVAQAIDDPTNVRWTSTNLDMLISMVQDQMFEAILDGFEFLTSNTESLTPSSGAVAISSLAKRFYRVQKVLNTVTGIELHPKISGESYPQPTYEILGGSIITTPTVSGSNSLSVRYSYIPGKFTNLANDNTLLAIEFPEGHEGALVYLTAAFALSKGDSESITQVSLLADVAVNAMLAHIARLYPIGANARVAQVKAQLMRNPLVQQGGLANAN